jgi:hypothetical protein
MREINDVQIKRHAALRFRSEYDYALFEYHRSAKVIAFLEAGGVTLHGRALDCGCGGGGMPLSIAEHVDVSIGIDPFDRASAGSGTSASRARTAWRCLSRQTRSISCSRTPSSNMLQTLLPTCKSAGA